MAHTLHVKKALNQQQNEIDDFTIYSMLSLSDINEANQTIFHKNLEQFEFRFSPCIFIITLFDNLLY